MPRHRLTAQYLQLSRSPSPRRRPSGIYPRPTPSSGTTSTPTPRPSSLSSSTTRPAARSSSPLRTRSRPRTASTSSPTSSPPPVPPTASRPTGPRRPTTVSFLSLRPSPFPSLEVRTCHSYCHVHANSILTTAPSSCRHLFHQHRQAHLLRHSRFLLQCRPQ